VNNMSLIFPTILLLFSSLLFIKAPTNFLWKLSVLFTEWSAHFALFSFSLATFYLFQSEVLPAFIFIVTGLVYVYPSLAAVFIGRKLQKETSSAFGIDTSPFSFSFLKLFTPFRKKKIHPITKTYFESVGLSLDLDFYRNDDYDKQPCVIVVHGGGWDSGDREQLPELNYYLASKGIAVASITYRLAPQHKFPAPLEDLRNARIYLQKNAGELGIDPTNFFYLGRSAGGQVVLTEAYSNPDPSVKGVIAFYAPADMAWGYGFPCWKYVMDSRRLQRNYIGGSPQETGDAFERASATHLVKPGLPPTLMLCGRNDVLTSFLHNIRLIEKLKPAGVPYYLLDIPWGVHGFDFNIQGPGAQLSTYCVEEFVKGRS
jgi:acetyl esterase/lipase